MNAEEELARACAAGNPEAWRRFVDLYADWVLRIARATLRRRGDPALEGEAEDAAAEVFRWLVERDRALFRSFRAPFNLKAWLAVLARRACGRILRKRRAAPGGAEPVAPPAEASRLEELLGGLPAEDRLLLQLFFIHACSYEEIAQALGISVESVGKQKFRALQKLKELARRAGYEP